MMEFSQKLKRTKRSMDVVVQKRLTDARHARRTKQTQGIALVVVLLSAMVLMVSMLAISATMAISSQRTTVDQSATLQAQYAAESGISYGQERFAEGMALLQLLRFEKTVGRASIQTAINDYCGSSTKNSSAKSGEIYCDGLPENASRNFTLFVNYITDVSKANANDGPYISTYPTTDSAKRTEYWKGIFGTGLTSTVNTTISTGLTTSYTVKYGFTPKHVKVITGGYRIFFAPVTIESTGTVSKGSQVIAARRLTATPATPLYSIDVSRSSFSNYNYFVNRRQLPSILGGTAAQRRLNFVDNETFEGRVHVNGKDENSGAALFSATSSTGGARFNGGFTTAAKELYWSSSTKVAENILFPGGHQLGTDQIDLPENASNQRVAVVGRDSEDATEIANIEKDQNGYMAARYGKQTTNATNTSTYFSNGVYYGNGTQSGSSWQKGNPDRGGGIYIKGNVDDLRLSTVGTAPNNLQVIKIKQTNVVAGKTNIVNTTFTQTSSTGWTVTTATTVDGKTTTPPSTSVSSGSFNGLIFVEGSVGNSSSQLDVATNATSAEGLGGDGTSAADIAGKSQLTVAASGNIYVKRDLTYTEDPRSVKDNPITTNVDESAVNVLGIYSEGGDVKVDGPKDENIKVHASIMAVGKERSLLDITSDGHGFGTIDYKRDRKAGANISPQIELLGGIIEEQSQGVGQIGREYRYRYSWCTNPNYCPYDEVSTKGGYNRAFSWDTRYDSGFTPPYFPTQLRFTQKCQEGDPSVGNTVGPTCSRNTQMLWVTGAG